MILLATGWHLLKNGRAIVLSLVGLVVVAFGVLTVQQEDAWKDDLTIFTDGSSNNARHKRPVSPADRGQRRAAQWQPDRVLELMGTPVRPAVPIDRDATPCITQTAAVERNSCRDRCGALICRMSHR